MLEVEAAEWALLQEIWFLRRQMNRVYAHVPRVSEELLAVSRQLDRALLRYQAAFALRVPSETHTRDGVFSG